MRIRLILYILMLLPAISFGQVPDSSYSIYSTFLDSLHISRGKNAVFVIHNGADISKADDNELFFMVKACRDYLKSKSDTDYKFMEYAYHSLGSIITKDTLWLGLIARLNLKMKQPFSLKNDFASKLRVQLISNHHFLQYFTKRNLKKKQHVFFDWNKFHLDYSPNALLVDFSEIVSDGQRAVFYYGDHCDSLCGAGGLVLFYNDNGTWKYLREIGMWIS